MPYPNTALISLLCVLLAACAAPQSAPDRGQTSAKHPAPPTPTVTAKADEPKRSTAPQRPEEKPQRRPGAKLPDLPSSLQGLQQAQRLSRQELNQTQQTQLAQFEQRTRRQLLDEVAQQMRHKRPALPQINRLERRLDKLKPLLGADERPQLQRLQQGLARKSRALRLRQGLISCQQALAELAIHPDILQLPLRGVIEQRIVREGQMDELLCGLVRLERDVEQLSPNSERAKHHSFRIWDENTETVLHFTRRSLSRTWFLGDIVREGESLRLSYRQRTERLIDYLDAARESQ